MFPSPSLRTEQISYIEPSGGDDSLYDGLYGEEFEEDFATSTGTPANHAGLIDAVGDDASAELLKQTKGIAITQEPDEAKPIPTLDSRPRLSTDPLPPKPLSVGNSSGGGSLSYPAQVGEQFPSGYRQAPSQERACLEAVRLP